MKKQLPQLKQSLQRLKSKLLQRRRTQYWLLNRQMLLNSSVLWLKRQLLPSHGDISNR